VFSLGRQYQALLAVEDKDIETVKKIDPSLLTMNMSRSPDNDKYVDNVIKSDASFSQFNTVYNGKVTGPTSSKPSRK